MNQQLDQPAQLDNSSTLGLLNPEAVMVEPRDPDGRRFSVSKNQVERSKKERERRESSPLGCSPIFGIPSSPYHTWYRQLLLLVAITGHHLLLSTFL